MDTTKAERIAAFIRQHGCGATVISDAQITIHMEFVKRDGTIYVESSVIPATWRDAKIALGY